MSKLYRNTQIEAIIIKTKVVYDTHIILKENLIGAIHIH